MLCCARREEREIIKSNMSVYASTYNKHIISIHPMSCYSITNSTYIWMHEITLLVNHLPAKREYTQYFFRWERGTKHFPTDRATPAPKNSLRLADATEIMCAVCKKETENRRKRFLGMCEHVVWVREHDIFFTLMVWYKRQQVKKSKLEHKFTS